MGFTTDNVDTTKVTTVERNDVNNAVTTIADNEGWDYSDVRNRAIMWYWHKYKNGELDDPKVDNAAEESLEDARGGWRDLFK